MGFFSDFRSRIPFNRADPQPDLPAAGVFHYLRETPARKVRLHLRLESDGRGLLLVNANRAFHLNPSAASMAYLNLEGRSEEQVVQALVRRFHVSKANALHDYRAFCDQLAIMTNPDEHCPICELELETTAPFSDRPSA